MSSVRVHLRHFLPEKTRSCLTGHPVCALIGHNLVTQCHWLITIYQVEINNKGAVKTFECVKRARKLILLHGIIVVTT